jgi:hypothetical protein
MIHIVCGLPQTTSPVVFFMVELRQVESGERKENAKWNHPSIFHLVVVLVKIII